MKKVFVLVISVLMVLCLVFGCAQAPAADAPAAAEPAAEEPVAAEPAAEEPAVEAPKGFENIFFGISTGATSAGWRDNCTEEITNVCEEYLAAGKIAGYKFSHNTNNGDAIEQADIIRSFVDDPQVNVIMVNANDTEALNGVIGEAIEAGKLVICYDSGVTADGVLNVTTDQYTRFYDLVTKFSEMMGGEGTVFQVQGIEGHIANNWRVGATDDALKNFPGINLVTTVTGAWSQQTGKEATAQVLASGTEYDGIISQDAQAYGVLLAANEANKLPRVMVGETSVSFFKLWKEIRESGADFTAVVAPNPPGIGATAIRLAYHLALGETFKDGVVNPDDNTYYYTVSNFYTDENFDEAWELMKDRPDDYQMSESLNEEQAAALFN